jgi:uncharacterized protein YtpQ (UPF0354 family)
LGFLDLFKSTPSPERFSKIAADAMRAAGFSAPIQIDQAEFRLLLGEGGKQIFNLNNFYRDYCRVEKSERKNVVQSYVQSMTGQDMPAAYADAKDKLLPVLRNRSMIEYVALAVDGESDKSKLPASMPFSADTAIMLAYDTEHSMMTLTGATLRDWGVSFDTALAAATDNLRDATVSSFEQLMPGLFLGSWNDAYDTSRLLFPDVVYQLGIAGEPVMMIPTRNRFLAASANDSEAQLTMIGLARQFADEEGRQLSALMYRYQDGRPVEFHPTNPEVAARLAELRRKTLAEDYAGQKDLLEKSHEKTGVDLFVASYQLITAKESGREASFTVWTEDVDTLLPEAELVALVSTAELGGERAGPPKFVAWRDLQAATGAFEQLPERYPARYKPANFPGKAARDALPATDL